MAYVNRSGVSKAGDRAGAVFRFGDHHGKMAMTFWIARDCVDMRFDREIDRYRWYPGERLYEGVVLIVAPGHGKTEMAMSYVALAIAQNPRTQALYLHAIANMAERAKNYIAACFSRDSESGRRCYALFGLEYDQNNASEMRLKLPERLKDPTLIAAGVTTKGLGSNLMIQVKDDVVPQSDVDQETERSRRFDTVQQTWNTRFRGSREQGADTFDINVGTLWHHDDYLSRMVQMVREGKAKYAVCIVRCGGPNTRPRFEPVWPEMYPASYLKRKYEQMKNPRGYSANYMAQPLADESRIVKELRFYDATTGQHLDFIRTCETHLSADPAAVNRPGADKAGLIFAGIGDIVQSRRVSEGITEESRETVCRVLSAAQIHATQTELAEGIASFVETQNRVDTVHVEGIGGFIAVTEILRNQYGIESVRHTAGQKNKETRLRHVAGLLEDGSPGITAVVEFPGQPITDEDGSPKLDKNGRVILGPRDDIKWLIDQILNFGVTKEDHAVDALTQLLKYLGPQLNPAMGEFQAEVGTHRPQSGDAKARMLADFMRQSKVADDISQSLAVEDTFTGGSL